jgi:SAM-dependent methyltransferase
LGGVVTDFETFSDRSAGSTDVYEAYIKEDPYRRGMHYPAVISEIGSLEDKRILDAGTGDGQLPRLLASKGASVVGFDHNPNMIEQALVHKEALQLNVRFVEAKPQSFSDTPPFDEATSVMVLNYASDIDDLIAFFQCAQRHLVAGGRFVSIVLNPRFTAFGMDYIVRRITKLDGNRVRMEFLDEVSGKQVQEAKMHQYSVAEFEQAAIAGGMRPQAWKELFASPEAMKLKGERFWQPCHQHQPYAMYIATKE